MFHQKVTKLTECLACGGNHLELILDLGNQPPANSYKNTAEEVQETFPLAVNLCTDCYHLQLTDVVNPEILYKDYLYVSGTSQTMKDHCKWFADFVLEQLPLWPLKKVLDIGCNDGTQLDAFQKLNFSTWGVEPAKNLVAISQKNHTVYPDFFENCDIKGFFGVITAQNVFAHNTNPLAFLEKAKKHLDHDGLLFIQTSQADMIINNEFDTIYHEHISFYNINSMNVLCKRAGLNLLNVVKCPLHGNSYIFVIGKGFNTNGTYLPRTAHIENLIAMEAKTGLYNRETYTEYAKKCQTLVTELKSRIEFYTRNEIGYLAIGYGAAAKGMTLLNYANIKLDFIVDDNPFKQGKFTPGLGIPIVPSSKLNDVGTSLFVPLAWNFFDEITDKIIKQRNNDYDLFVRYFPRVQITKAKELKHE